jgi:hypothetical protein
MRMLQMMQQSGGSRGGAAASGGLGGAGAGAGAGAGGRGPAGGGAGAGGADALGSGAAAGGRGGLGAGHSAAAAEKARNDALCQEQFGEGDARRPLPLPPVPRPAPLLWHPRSRCPPLLECASRLLNGYGGRQARNLTGQTAAAAARARVTWAESVLLQLRIKRGAEHGRCCTLVARCVLSGDEGGGRGGGF